MQVDIALSGDVIDHNGGQITLDLNRKAGRLLAESAAIVLAHRAGHDLENLG